MAKAKLSGTRMRRATRDQVATAGCASVGNESLIVDPQQLPRCRDDFFGSDLQQSFLRLTVPSVTRQAASAPQHDRGRAKRAVARRVRRTEDPDDRNLERCRQVHGPGIATNE